jgi:hypothetical protein
LSDSAGGFFTFAGLELFIAVFQSGGGFTFIARRNASRGGDGHCKSVSLLYLLIAILS